MFERPEALPTVLDALGAPADVAEWAASAVPGPDVVGPLAVIDPSTVDGAAQIDLLIALERQIAWLTAAQQRVLASLDGTALDWAGKESVDYTREQVGAALRLSPGHAADRLSVGRPVRHLATHPHRPGHRPDPRLRTADLPPAQSAYRLRGRPRPHLHLPPLQPTRPQLRNRPR
jgi:hypothetical protein